LYYFFQLGIEIGGFLWTKRRARKHNTRARNTTIIIDILCTNQDTIASSFSWKGCWETKEEFWIRVTLPNCWYRTVCFHMISGQSPTLIGKYNSEVLSRTSKVSHPETITTLLSSLSLLGTIENFKLRYGASETNFGITVIVPTLPTPLNHHLDNVDSKIYEVWIQSADEKYGKVEVLKTLPSISKYSRLITLGSKRIFKSIAVVICPSVSSSTSILEGQSSTNEVWGYENDSFAAEEKVKKPNMHIDKNITFFI